VLFDREIKEKNYNGGIKPKREREDKNLKIGSANKNARRKKLKSDSARERQTLKGGQIKEGKADKCSKIKQRRFLGKEMENAKKWERQTKAHVGKYLKSTSLRKDRTQFFKNSKGSKSGRRKIIEERTD